MKNITKSLLAAASLALVLAACTPKTDKAADADTVSTVTPDTTVVAPADTTATTDTTAVK
jgi:hypothetical protein